jgi:type VI protein secretion system component VasF
VSEAASNMTDERSTISGAELTRWVLLGGVIVLGLVLYFWFGTTTPEVVHAEGALR